MLTTARIRPTLVLVLALAFLAGCAKPPQADIDSARKALKDAEAAEASEYAPKALAAVRDAEAALDAELKAQEEKFALFRSYKKSTELATAAKAASAKAASEANAGKERAKQEAQSTISRAKTAVQEVKVLLESAPKGKGTAADLAAFQSDLATLEMSINEIEASLPKGKYLDAKARAEAALRDVEGIREEINRAIEAQKAAKASAPKARR